MSNCHTRKGLQIQLQFSIRAAKLGPEIKAPDYTEWAGGVWRAHRGQSLGRDSGTRPSCTEGLLCVCRGAGEKPPFPAVLHETALRPGPPYGPGVDVRASPCFPYAQGTWYFLRMMLSPQRDRPRQPRSALFPQLGSLAQHCPSAPAAGLGKVLSKVWPPTR